MQDWNKALKWISTGVFAVSILSGCAAKDAGPGAPKAAVQPSGETAQAPKATGEGSKTEAEKSGASVNTGTNMPAAVQKGDQPGNQPAETAQKKLYRMNKVYRFVPIDKNTPDKVVLLTFDDGPKEDSMISQMLDTLDKHKAKAIFFVNGYRVKKHPELLKKIADRGQTIGNHSWDHIDLKKETDEVVDKQLGDVQKIVKDTVGYSPVFFRPPYGAGGDRVKQKANKLGMLFMTWSNGSLDWDSSTKKDPDLVIANVLKQLHPGANILMHELPWTVKGLDTLLTKLEEKGYGFIDPATIDLQLNGSGGGGAAK